MGYEVQHFVKKGVSIMDAELHFEDEGAQSWLKNDVGCVKIPIGGLVMVPAGHIFHLVFHNAAKEVIKGRNARKKAEETREYGHVWSWPLWNVNWFASLSKEAKAAITAINVET